MSGQILPGDLVTVFSPSGRRWRFMCTQVTPVVGIVVLDPAGDPDPVGDPDGEVQS